MILGRLFGSLDARRCSFDEHIHLACMPHNGCLAFQQQNTRCKVTCPCWKWPLVQHVRNAEHELLCAGHRGLQAGGRPESARLPRLVRSGADLRAAAHALLRPQLLQTRHPGVHTHAKRYLIAHLPASTHGSGMSCWMAEAWHMLDLQC